MPGKRDGENIDSCGTIAILYFYYVGVRRVSVKLRPQLWKTNLLSLLVTVLFGTNALAACESLFEYGIYDVEGNTSETERAASFREWICQREFPAKADAAKFVAITSLPADVLPVKYGLNNSEADFKESYGAFCADRDMNSPLNRDLSRNLQKINGKMLDRFNACVSKDGLHAWIKQTKEPGRFYLNFLHRNPSGNAKPATVITITRFNVACDDLRLPFELGGSEKSFTCARIDPTNQSTLWVLASEPVVEGNNYWVGKTTYTPTGDMPAAP